MKAEKFPLVISEVGVSARIRKLTQSKNGRQYTIFVVDYRLLGQRKREARSNLAEAKTAAQEACRKIASGQQHVLELKSNDRLAYLRATEALSEIQIPIDVACQEFANAIQILGGTGALAEAARFFAKQFNGVIGKTVPDAVGELIAQIEAEQKNTNNATRRKDAWLKLLRSHLQNKFAEDFNCTVAELSSAILESWLIGLKASERTRCNIRDCVAYFLKWAKGRNYLPKDADPLAHVQKFRKRKRGAVQIISADGSANERAHRVGRFAFKILLHGWLAGWLLCGAQTDRQGGSQSAESRGFHLVLGRTLPLDPMAPPCIEE